MNRFIRYCFVAAGVFIVIGLAVCAVCFTFGGKKVFAEAIDYANKNTNIEIGNGSFYITDKKVSKDDTSASSIIKVDKVEKFLAKDIDDLKIIFGAGELTIDESEDEYVYINVDSVNDISCKLSGGRLVIESDRNDSFSKLTQKNNVTISIPKSIDLEKVAFSIGACECEVKTELNVEKKISAEVGAGEIIFNKVTADEMKIDLGAGNVEIHEMNLNKADFKVGMGCISAKGDVNNKLKADCSMGSIDLKLARKEAEYNIDVDCSMGSIEVGKKEYAGLSSNKKLEGTSNTELDLECSMGSISVDFN